MGAKYPLVLPDRSGKASKSTSGVIPYLFSNEWRAVEVRFRGRPKMAALLVKKRRSLNVSPVSRVERMRSCAVETVKVLCCGGVICNWGRGWIWCNFVGIIVDCKCFYDVMLLRNSRRNCW